MKMYIILCFLAFISVSSARSADNRALCSLPIVQGRCYAYFERYAFNTNTNKCEKFVYGGCGGNGNNFNTLQECKDGCEFRL